MRFTRSAAALVSALVSGLAVPNCTTSEPSGSEPSPDASSIPSTGDGSLGTDAEIPDANGTPPDVDAEAGVPHAPDGKVSVLYAPPEGDPVLLAYSRVVRLAHGAAKGTLLGTFEHTRTNGAPSEYVIRKSTDDGVTWSTLAKVADGESGEGHPASVFYQPFLFELPTKMGNYPAGTLLLTGNVLPKVGAVYRSSFQLWRSVDAGATWTFVSTYQLGEAAERRGIWEPFLDVDGEGRLVCYFADERRSQTQSQIIAHLVSDDGGDTWSANADGTTRVAPGLVLDVASNVQAPRPGMPTVATLPDGSRVMAFELCAGGRNTCEIRVKTSTDGGATWGAGPSDMGALVQTKDGRYAANSPYIMYSPAGQLLLGSMHALKTADNSPALEDYQAVFVNTQGGAGTWSWIPAPLPVPHEAVPAPCYMNYSPHLLDSRAGASLRYTTASQDAAHPCAERTVTASAGTFPYASSFESGVAAGWKSYGGCWEVAGGIYSDTCGGQALGNKSLAGSTGWTNYRVEADVRVDTAGANAGLIVRLGNPAVGIDAHDGYYVGVNGDLFIGKQSYAYTELGSVPMTGGFSVGQFFHLTVDAAGCTFTATVKRSGSSDAPTTLTVTDPSCFPAGAIGVRDFEGNASFRDIRAVALP